jgi:hypothetical protein
MLSGEALNLAFVLRNHIGALMQGDGPSIGQLKTLAGLADATFDAAVTELDSVGFVRINRTENAAESQILVLAPLQIYLDDLENQGNDDM